MPRRDLFHNAVRSALIADGWIITHDPLTLAFGITNVFIDLGAESSIAAERGDRKIAVEIKGFRSPSAVADLEDALGQFTLYRILLKRNEPDRVLYLAVSQDTYEEVFREPDARDLVIPEAQLRLLIIDEDKQKVNQWIEP